VALVVSGFVYLRPGPGTSSPPAHAVPLQQAEPVLDSMEWTSAQDGWLVMQDAALPRSALFRTTDGGRHWQRLHSTENGFLGVSFVDTKHGLLQVLQDSSSVAAASQPVLQTHDSGSHWLQMPLPNAVHTAVRPEFVDPRHGWLITDTPFPPSFDLTIPPAPPDFELWRTEDGGQHWRLLVETDRSHAVSHGILEQDTKLDVSFADPQRGWLEALGRDGSLTLYMSQDGGQSWAPTALPAPPSGWTGQPLMTSPPRISSDGWGALVLTDMPTQSQVALDTGTPPAFRQWVLWSRDAGQTWSSPVQVPDATPPPTSPITRSSPVFADGRNGWWMASGQVWVSSDSGRTWKRAGRPPPGWTFARFFPVNSQVTWAEAMADDDFPGRYWRLYVTRDAGRHWQRMPIPPMDTAAGA
jgi:photosystem II stability/assembly factor-like uncharacterized protein